MCPLVFSRLPFHSFGGFFGCVEGFQFDVLLDFFFLVSNPKVLGLASWSLLPIFSSRCFMVSILVFES